MSWLSSFLGLDAAGNANTAMGQEQNLLNQYGQQNAQTTGMLQQIAAQGLPGQQNTWQAPYMQAMGDINAQYQQALGDIIHQGLQSGTLNSSMLHQNLLALARQRAAQLGQTEVGLRQQNQQNILGQRLFGMQALAGMDNPLAAIQGYGNLAGQYQQQAQASMGGLANMAQGLGGMFGMMGKGQTGAGMGGSSVFSGTPATLAG